MRLICFILLLFFTNLVQAQPCNEEMAIKIYSEFEKFYSQPNPWPAVQRDKMSFAFLSPNKKAVYIYSRTANVIDKVQDLETCKSNFYISRNNLAEFDGQMGLLTFEHEIFKVFDRDFLFFTDLQGIPEEPYKFDLMIKWYVTHALHEQFHLHTVGMAYQQTMNLSKVSPSIFKEFTSHINRLSFDKCESPDSLYMKVLNRDFELIRQLENIWELSTSNKSLKKIAQEIVENRRRLKGTIYESCLDGLREMERAEGTATFFPLQAKIMKDTEFAENPLDTDNPATFDSKGNGPWYLTGARLSKLADLLSSERALWQEWVQEGLPLDLVLERLSFSQAD